MIVLVPVGIIIKLEGDGLGDLIGQIGRLRDSPDMAHLIMAICLAKECLKAVSLIFSTPYLEQPVHRLMLQGWVCILPLKIWFVK